MLRSLRPRAGTVQAVAPALAEALPTPEPEAEESPVLGGSEVVEFDAAEEANAAAEPREPAVVQEAIVPRQTDAPSTFLDLARAALRLLPLELQQNPRIALFSALALVAALVLRRQPRLRRIVLAALALAAARESS